MKKNKAVRAGTKNNKPARGKRENRLSDLAKVERVLAFYPTAEAVERFSKEIPNVTNQTLKDILEGISNSPGSLLKTQASLVLKEMERVSTAHIMMLASADPENKATKRVCFILVFLYKHANYYPLMTLPWCSHASHAKRRRCLHRERGVV